MTKPEIVLWAHLRNHGVAGVHFRRQHALGPYILDFYCSALKLCIELDGITHSTPEAARHDELRTAWLEGQGVRVVRFAAADVMSEEGLTGVLSSIELLVREVLASDPGQPPPSRCACHLPRSRGRG